MRPGDVVNWPRPDRSPTNIVIVVATYVLRSFPIGTDVDLLVLAHDGSCCWQRVGSSVYVHERGCLR